ncbi:MAG TPA: hypothetical protein VIM00_07660 [Candidatus Acidoferrum sp.]|jgi:hypothetical protein
MAPVQLEILKALGGKKLSMNELVLEVRQKSQASPIDIKAAVLPLINTNRIEMTPERKLHLNTE